MLVRYLVVSLVLFVMIPAYAVNHDTSDDDVTSAKNAAITITVPEHLLIDQHDNYGLIVRENSDDSILVTLVTDSDILELPKTVFLASGENHGLFQMDIHGTGDVQITAILNNVLYSAQTTIYNPINNDYRIILSAPDSVGVSDVKIGVHMVDHFGNPIPAKSDTDIRFNTFNFDTLTDVVTIPSGKSSVFASGVVHGDAIVSAYSENSLSDDVTIHRVRSNAAVQLGIAPEIILGNSFAYLFIWIAIVGVIATTIGALVGSGAINDAQNTGSFVITSAELKKGSTGNAVLQIDLRNGGSSNILGVVGMLGFKSGCVEADTDCKSSTGTDGKVDYRLATGKPNDPTVTLVAGNNAKDADDDGNYPGRFDLRPGDTTTLIFVIPSSVDMNYGDS